MEGIVITRFVCHRKGERAGFNFQGVTQFISDCEVVKFLPSLKFGTRLMFILTVRFKNSDFHLSCASNHVKMTL